MFIEKKASKNSLANRKLLHGYGINDAEYMVRCRDANSDELFCPYYKKWSGMITRCYSKRLHEKSPTYKDCFVCDEWLTFSNFKLWMKQQDWKGMELDKDLLVSGNKSYNPNTCIFVPRYINTLIIDCGASRGENKKGVCFDKAKGKYLASCREYGKNRYLGRYKTEEEAWVVYNCFKSNHIREVVKTWGLSEKLSLALLRIADQYIVTRKHDSIEP